MKFEWKTNSDGFVLRKGHYVGSVKPANDKTWVAIASVRNAADICLASQSAEDGKRWVEEQIRRWEDLYGELRRSHEGQAK